MDERALRGRIRSWLAVFVGGLVVSGVTALPLEWETRLLVQLAGPGTRVGAMWPELASAIDSSAGIRMRSRPSRSTSS